MRSRRACEAEQESVHCWNVIRKISERNYHSVDNSDPAGADRRSNTLSEVVHKATDPDFDLYKLVPAPTNTPVDAGPYITLGMCTHPDTGVVMTIHRLCIQGKDELSIFLHRVHHREQWQKEQKSLTASANLDQ